MIGYWFFTQGDGIGLKSVVAINTTEVSPLSLPSVLPAMLRRLSPPVIALVAGLVLLPIPGRAAVEISGSVTPDELTFWTGGGDADATARLGNGNNTTGTVTINGGSTVTLYDTEVGNHSNGTGTVTVSGAGSTYNSRFLRIGEHGTGTVTIQKGATYSGFSVFVAEHLDSTGTFIVTGTGSSATVQASFEVGGQNRDAEVTVSNGGLLSTSTSYILGANQVGKQSIVTVTGAGSRWENSGRIYLGYSYKGELVIADGGVVSALSAHFGESVTTTTHGSLTVAGADSALLLTGDLVFNLDTKNTIHISDGGRVEAGGVFRATGSNSPDSFNADSGVWLDGGKLTAEAMLVSRGQLHGQGTIETGGLIGSGYTELLDFNGSKTATANLTDNGDNLLLKVTPSGSGNLGVDHLLVRNGAKIGSQDGVVGYDAAADSTATVTGAGSEWTIAQNLNVGRFGNGTLEVADGGKVTAGNNLYITSQGTVNLQVGGHGTLIEADTVTNNGMMFFFAGGGLAAGEYEPISTSTLLTGSRFQGVGGTWDEGNQVFSVSAALNRSGGIDSELVENRRVELVPGFLNLSFSAGATDVTLNAMAESVSQIDGEFVLGAYFFDNTSTALGDVVLVSYYVGEGYEQDDFSFWHENSQGGEWVAYDPGSQSYADGWVNFTVADFSGYAVTSLTVVPEPASSTLLAAGAAILFLRRRKR